MEKTWTPNDKQQKFLEILGENPDGLTLGEIEEKYGIKFATGSINTLKVKGLVDTSAEKEIVVQAKRKVKVYRLVK